MEKRLEAALNDLKEKEQRCVEYFSPSVLKNRQYLKEKLGDFDDIIARAKAEPDFGDKVGLKGVQLQRRELEKQIYPGLIRRLVASVVSNFLMDKKVAKVQQQVQSNTDSLRAAMVKSGLGNYFQKVQAQMKQGNREFSLPVSYHVSEHDRMDLQLHFKKDGAGNYHFENYKATLQSEIEKGKPKVHTFEMEQGVIMSTDKAYNLLSGRAVLQTDGRSWMQLDFNDKDAAGNLRTKHFPEGYGFEISKALAALPLKHDERFSMLHRLQNGESVHTQLLIAGKEHHVAIAANPIKKEVAVYDATGQKTTVDQLKDGQKQGRKMDNVQQLVPKQLVEQDKVKGKGIKI
jgi:hypothetical protein